MESSGQFHAPVAVPTRESAPGTYLVGPGVDVIETPTGNRTPTPQSFRS
jgi:hypothetical protein